MRVMAIGDLHVPFQHKHAFEFLEHMRDEYSPDAIVQIGDLLDIHTPSRHEADPDGHSAGRELEIARHVIRSFFQLFPSGYMCLGNHDLRYERAAYRNGIPKEVVKSVHELFKFPKEWEADDTFLFDEVVYQHEPICGGDYAYFNAAKNNMRSTVSGHLHTKFGVIYFANRDKLIFGASTGCLIDKDAYSMQYAKKMREKPILGSLIIDDGVAVTPVPMLLNSSGDWIGK
jgi:hypothetical protein